MPTCCLCPNPATITEQRPTGKNGELEQWGFCLTCFTELQRQLTDHDPLICERYKVFLQFIHGGYGMQRTFNGNQASELQPADGSRGEARTQFSDKGETIE